MNKKHKPNSNNIHNILIIAIIIFAIILTLGWFFDKKKIEEEHENLETQISKISERIKSLKLIKSKLRQNRKISFLIARISIGLLFIISDVTYIFFTLEEYNFTSIVNTTLTINGLILMIYSFLAFITYGTVGNLTSILKLKFITFLEEKHIDSLEELKALEIKLKTLEHKLADKKEMLDFIEPKQNLDMFYSALNKIK